MTTSTAGQLAAHTEKDHKEKAEKRRALGRGLESLLPGPRVVANTAVAPASSVGKPQIPPPARIDHATASQAVAAPKVGPPVVPSVGGASAAVSDVQSAEDAGKQTGVSASHETAQKPSATHQPAPHSPTLPEGSPYEPAYTDPAGDLAGRPATDPHGYQPPFDSSQGDGTITIQAQAETRVPTNLVINLAIADIDKNPFQTRYVEDDEALEELADSIKANGVVQPIVVRPAKEDGRFILILGERRLHASRKAAKTHIPALVRRVSEQQAAEMTIVENLQREDLSALEQAEAFRVLSGQFNLTQQQIAERVGLSRTSVANYMRLLKLPRDVMQMLAQKQINFAQAKELLKLGDNDRIAEAAIYAVKKGMNIEQIEMLVLRMDGLLDPIPGMPGVEKREKASSGARWVDPNVRAAQMDLERMLGVRVRIRDRRGKGKIVIEYHTVDDYERVVEMLRAKK